MQKRLTGKRLKARILPKCHPLSDLKDGTGVPMFAKYWEKSAIRATVLKETCLGSHESVLPFQPQGTYLMETYQFWAASPEADPTSDRPMHASMGAIVSGVI